MESSVNLMQTTIIYTSRHITYFIGNCLFICSFIELKFFYNLEYLHTHWVTIGNVMGKIRPGKAVRFEGNPQPKILKSNNIY